MIDKRNMKQNIDDFHSFTSSSFLYLYRKSDHIHSFASVLSCTLIRMATKSSVWSYFDLPMSGKAACNKCGKQIKCEGSSTSLLRKHMMNVHHIDLNPKAVISDGESSTPSTQTEAKKPKTSSQPKITNFIKRTSMAELIAELAHDVIPALTDQLQIHPALFRGAKHEFAYPVQNCVEVHERIPFRGTIRN